MTSLKFELVKVEHLDFEGSGESSALYNYLCHLSKPEKPAQEILSCSLHSLLGFLDNIFFSLSVMNKRKKDFMEILEAVLLSLKFADMKIFT